MKWKHRHGSVEFGAEDRKNDDTLSMKIIIDRFFDVAVTILILVQLRGEIDILVIDLEIIIEELRCLLDPVTDAGENAFTRRLLLKYDFGENIRGCYIL